MNETIEMQLSNYMIDKATARLAFQRDVVRRIPLGSDYRTADVAAETLASMERRLAKLLVAHANLLAEQGRTDHRRIPRLSTRVASWASAVCAP